MPEGRAPCPTEREKMEGDAPSEPRVKYEARLKSIEKVVDPENLQLAFWKASRGQRHRPDQRDFAENLSSEFERMRSGLLACDYPVGRYTRFTIHDSKEREICAAVF